MTDRRRHDVESRVQLAANAARDLITYADALEQAGMADCARRARNVARETLWLTEELAAERSARRAIQRARDEAVQILANRAGAAAA